jgi:hypothetical protein
MKEINNYKFNLTNSIYPIEDHSVRHIESNTEQENKVRLVSNIKDLIAEKFEVENVHFISKHDGVGLEAMLHQINLLDELGIILSNGYDGDKMIDQAERMNIKFISHNINWGKSLSIKNIKHYINNYDLKWILLSHVDSSTGHINNLNEICEFANQKGIDIFVDCKNSFANFNFSLKNISMACASYRRAFNDNVNFEILVSNIETKSSNLVKDYFIENFNSIYTKFNLRTFESIEEKIIDKFEYDYSDYLNFSKKLNNILYKYNLSNNYNEESRIKTICQHRLNTDELAAIFSNQNIEIKHQNFHLKRKNWAQLLFFKNYTKTELDILLNKIEKSIIEYLKITLVI